MSVNQTNDTIQPAPPSLARSQIGTTVTSVQSNVFEMTAMQTSVVEEYHHQHQQHEPNVPTIGTGDDDDDDIIGEHETGEEDVITFELAGTLCESDLSHLELLERSIKHNTNIRHIELIPGAHWSIGGDKPRWTGVVATLKDTALLKDVWRDDMFGCEALYRIPIIGRDSNSFSVLTQTGLGVVSPPVSLESDTRFTSSPPTEASTRTDGNVLKNVGAILEYLNKSPNQMNTLVDSSNIEDYSKDFVRLSEISKKATAESSKSTDAVFSKFILTLYTNSTPTLPNNPTGNTFKKAPLGALKCSINIYQSADANAPNQPALWLMVRTYDPVLNTAIISRYGNTKLSACLKAPLVVIAEDNALKSCDAIAHSILTRLSADVPKTLDYGIGLVKPTSTTPLPDLPAFDSSSATLDLLRVCAYHYNVFQKHTGLATCDNSNLAVQNDYIFYGACLRTHNSRWTRLPLGLGRHHGFLLYAGQTVAQLVKCKGAFPLGIEAPRDSVDSICSTANDLTALDKQPYSASRERVTWANNTTAFVRHPKVLCAARIDASITYIESRIKAVDYLTSNFAVQRLRLWPVRSYISAPLASHLNLYELLVLAKSSSTITLSPIQVTELMHKIQETNADSTAFTFGGIVGTISHTSLKALFNNS